jgi:WD40 repeat protein
VLDLETLIPAVRELPSERVIAALPDQPAHTACFSQDGAYAALALRNGTAALYDAKTWKEIAQFRLPTNGGDSPVCCVVFSTDSRVLLAGNFDGYVAAFGTDDRQTRTTFRAHERPVLAAAISPDGQLAATGSTDRSARSFRLTDGTQVTTMTGHSSYVYGLSFSKSGSRILTYSDDNTAKLWETASGREIVTVFNPPHDGKLLMASFASAGNEIFGASQSGTLLLADAFPWDTAAYPGSPDLPAERRQELWKRLRLNKSATIDDIAW